MIRVVHFLKYKTMGTKEWHHQQKPNNLTIAYYFRFCEMRKKNDYSKHSAECKKKKCFLSRKYMYNSLDLTFLLFIFVLFLFFFLQKCSVLSRTVIILCAVILAVQMVGIGIVLTICLRGKLYAICCLIF